MKKTDSPDPIYLFIYLGISGLIFLVACIAVAWDLHKKEFQHFDDMVEGVKEAVKELVAALAIAIAWPFTAGVLFYECVWLLKIKPWVNKRYFGYEDSPPPPPPPLEKDTPSKEQVKEIWEQRNKVN